MNTRNGTITLSGAKSAKKDIEGRLRNSFQAILDRHGASLDEPNHEAVFKAMREANKLGYTNGFIRAKTAGK